MPQALASVPVDMPSAAPPAAASAKTGKEGMFASHLKAATDQQTSASSSRAGASTKHPRSRHAQDSSPETEKTGADQTAAGQGDSLLTATGLNGTTADAAGPPAANPDPASVPPADAAVTATNQGAALAAGQGAESAMARLLADLTAGNASTATSATTSTADVPPVAQTAVQPPSVPQIGMPAGPEQPSTRANGHPVAPELPTVAQELPTPQTDGSRAMPVASGQAADTGNRAAASPAAGFVIDNTGKSAPQPQQTATTTTGAQTAGQHTGTAPLPAASSAEAGLTPDGQARSGNPLIVQNTYGQIITIHQGNAQDEEAAGSDSPGSTLKISEQEPLDVNGNYIRSRLPKEPGGTAPEGGKQPAAAGTPQTGQQETVNAADTAKTAATAGEHGAAPKPQPVTGQETASLLFAHQQPGPSQQPTGSTPISSVALHLPSGMTVPDGTVVDQIIARFSVNKQLETGTVNLRLYPQELGELRLEIKVAQDNIKAHIVAQSPQAQEMIDRHLPRLREALEQQGLHLQQVEVSVAAHGQTGGERFQESNAWRQPAPSPSHTAAGQSDFTQEADDIAGDEAAVGTLSVLA